MALLQWQNIVDFLVLFATLYMLLRWGKDARALRMTLAIAALRAGALLAGQFDLAITALLLDAASLVAIVLLLIAYQSELRHALMRLDFVGWLVPYRRKVTIEKAARAVSSAAFALAHARIGALIVVTRRDSISDLIEGGFNLGGEISPEILEAIFQKDSPVHDGAAVIEGDYITRIAAILPATQRMDIPRGYGTRHRAALGLAEKCDALVVVVSEERGEVNLMRGREILKMDSAGMLESKLEEAQPGLRFRAEARLKQLFFGNLGLKAVALALSLAFWWISFFLVGHSVRTVTIPVEFSSVPANTEISRLSTSTVQVQIRGSAWILDSVSLNTLVARLDLAGAKEGPHTLNVNEATLDLPPGLRIQDISPRQITFNLVFRNPP
jgi:uncharacterized protein (TIGR00159 family)